MSNLARIAVRFVSRARDLSVLHNVKITPERTTPIRKRVLSQVKGDRNLNLTIHSISFRGYPRVNL